MSEHDLSNRPTVGFGGSGSIVIEGRGAAGTPVGGVVSVQGTGNPGGDKLLVTISSPTTGGGTQLPVNVGTWAGNNLATANAVQTPNDLVVPPSGIPLLADLNLFYDTAAAQWGRARGDPLNAGAGTALVGIRREVAHTLFAGIDPAANTAGTITLAAAGAGFFHLIYAMRFVRVATAALAGAALLTITTTNINGRQWRVGNNMIAGGTQIDLDEQLTSPLRSAVANTNTTIVFPAPGAAVSWSCEVEYQITTESL